LYGVIQMQTNRHRKTHRSIPPKTGERRQGLIVFLALCFLLGAVAGALIGTLSETGDLTDLMAQLSTETGDLKGFFHALWDATWFHLLVLLAGTSLLGILFVPVLSIARGYLLSCTAAAVLHSYPWKTVLVLLGIPAILEIPCFLVLAADAVRTSRRLAAAANGIVPHIEQDNPILRHTVICLLVLTISAVVETFILPVLLANCIS
jgi:uncharacterized membrane protein SpoIIM required for sporulation